jgi:transposase
MSNKNLKGFLKPGERVVLREAHLIARKKKTADRIKTISMLDLGFTYSEISSALFLDDSTLRRYYKEFLDSGLDGLLEDNHKPYNGKMDEEQEKILTKAIKENFYHSSVEIVVLIKELFGIDYSPQGLVHTLKRLGFSYKKTKLVPSKADPEKQLDFLAKYNEIKSNLSEKDKIYFLDGVHQLHNAQAGYCWIYKGTEKEVKANTGRNRININGALNVDDKELIFRDDETINAQSTINLLTEIEEKNPDAEKIYLIVDNARYYRNRAVSDHLNGSKIELIFLPPYSPNLNLIERLWKFFKKKVVQDKYYETYDIFRNVCLNFFRNIGEFRSELDSLITENFHIIGNNFCGSSAVN